MHFPKHWKLVSKGGVSAWGWSDESIDSATSDGESRVARIIDWLRSDMKGVRGDYGYPNRPMREQVLREFQHGADVVGVVSRNSYGCEVLNTARAMFVDVDLPRPGLVSAIAGLFRGGKKFEPALMKKIERWVADQPEWGWRVYRTRAGFRLMSTHAPVLPQAPECKQAFKAFGADWLYRKLCENQNCFRARLTPKPWRCGIEKLPKPARWPWLAADGESQFEQWHRRYEEVSRNKATCELIGQFGNTTVHQELRPLIDFHDEATGASSGMELA